MRSEWPAAIRSMWMESLKKCLYCLIKQSASVVVVIFKSPQLRFNLRVTALHFFLRLQNKFAAAAAAAATTKRQSLLSIFLNRQKFYSHFRCIMSTIYWYWILCNCNVSLQLNRSLRFAHIIFFFYFLSHSDCRLSISQSHTFATCNWIAFAEVHSRVAAAGAALYCMFPKRFYHLPIQRYHWKPVFWLQQQQQNTHNTTNK